LERIAKTRRTEGKAAAGLVALLAILVAAGGSNYVRNLQAEEASEQKRPFHGYDTDDRDALRAAYGAEVASAKSRYERHRSARQRASGAVMMDEAVADFDRVRAHTDDLRELGAQVAEREARSREIDQELAKRAALGEGWQAHLRRLTAI